jgi:hypothetical protein
MSTGLRPPRGVTLLQTPFLRVEHDEARKFVRYTRSSRGFASIAELDDVHLGLIWALQRLDRPRLSLLVDLRDAPPRNDPAFEQAIARHRGPMMQGFRRVAIKQIPVRAILGEVACCPCLQDAPCIVLLGVHREHQHRQPWAQPKRSPENFQAMHPRQGQVKQDHVDEERRLLQQRKELGAIRTLTDHRDLRIKAEYMPHTYPDHAVIVGNKNPDHPVGVSPIETGAGQSIFRAGESDRYPGR